ncbi:MAG: hypothetical protein KF861_07670 [Planctomycetaceae bacterium]|nr:hypothetical protein [Planctomycetaceae bacterium]
MHDVAHGSELPWWTDGCVPFEKNLPESVGVSTRFTSLSVVILGVLVTVWGAGVLLGQSSSPAESDLMDNLKGQVAALEQRVRLLEMQVSRLPSGGGFTFSPPTSVVPGCPCPDGVPSTWHRGDINGLRYYTAPLSLPGLRE